MDALKSSQSKNYPLSLVYTRQSNLNNNAGVAKRKIFRRSLPEKIALPTMDGIQFEDIRNIVCLEAQGNYTFIHLITGKKILVCKTLRDTEDSIRSDAFVRIHRSHTINMHLIVRYIKGKGGYVIMENGASINVSAGRKQEFLEAVNHFF